MNIDTNKFLEVDFENFPKEVELFPDPFSNLPLIPRVLPGYIIPSEIFPKPISLPGKIVSPEYELPSNIPSFYGENYRELKGGMQ